jgi:hypothetical protein
MLISVINLYHYVDLVCKQYIVSININETSKIIML